MTAYHLKLVIVIKIDQAKFVADYHLNSDKGIVEANLCLSRLLRMKI